MQQHLHRLLADRIFKAFRSEVNSKNVSYFLVVFKVSTIILLFPIATQLVVYDFMTVMYRSVHQNL